MRILYMATAGIGDPTRLSLPLHLAANGSLEAGQEVDIVFAGDATELLLGDNLAQTHGIGVAPVRDLLAKLRDHAVPVYV